LHIRVTGAVSTDRLTIEIADDGAGIGNGDDGRDGIGLANTRARLRGLYGDRAALTLSSGKGGAGTVVAVTLPTGESDARARPA
jgi:LytS/YehU family sensor histidine kinase